MADMSALASVGGSGAIPLDGALFPPPRLRQRVGEFRADVDSTRERLDAFAQKVRAFEAEVTSTYKRLEVFIRRTRAPDSSAPVRESRPSMPARRWVPRLVENVGRDSLERCSAEPIEVAQPEERQDESARFDLLANHRVRITHLAASRQKRLMIWTAPHP